ncbi:MAG TPA: CGNR zinc finger domain-containing protein [Nitriliruptorales bacterium]
MEFGSHLDASVSLAVELVNALTPTHEQSRALGSLDAEQRRWRLVAALGDRENRARAARSATADEIAAADEAARLLRRVFAAAQDGDLDAAAIAINEVLHRFEARPELSRHDERPWHLHFDAGAEGLAAGLAASSATALALVVNDSGTDRLGVCDAEACERVYVDTSRNASKRYCSTACQNRTKAAAFRARRAAG